MNKTLDEVIRGVFDAGYGAGKDSEVGFWETEKTSVAEATQSIREAVERADKATTPVFATSEEDTWFDIGATDFKNNLIEELGLDAQQGSQEAV